MFASNDDMWDVKITLQCVTFNHGSKNLLVKKPSEKHQLKVGKKNGPNHSGLIKIDLSLKTKGSFLPLSLWGIFWSLNPIWKTWNSSSVSCIEWIQKFSKKHFAKGIGE